MKKHKKKKLKDKQGKTIIVLLKFRGIALKDNDYYS